MILGAAAVLVLPVMVGLAEQSAAIPLLDAAWGIPIAAVLGLAAIGASNKARLRVQRTVGRAGGEGRARAARILGTVAICLAITAAISVGFYELLLHFEK